MKKAAFEVIQKVQPSLIKAIERLLDLGQTPTQIADKVAIRDISLAGLVELAASHMKSVKENDQ